MSLKKELKSLAICLESTIFTLFTLKLSDSCLNFFLTLINYLVHSMYFLYQSNFLTDLNNTFS